MKLASRGVGRTGIAGEGTLRLFVVGVIPPKGAIGDVSVPSDTEIVRLLFLRLDEEKFFRRPVAALVPKRTGEPGTLLSLSAEVTLVSAEAVDDAMSVVSDPGKGEDPFRLLGRLLGRRPGDGRGLKARLGSTCWLSGMTKADWGCSGIGSAGNEGEGIDKVCDFEASVSELSDILEFVSIFSGFFLVPEILRSRTPGLVFRAPRLGGLGKALCGGWERFAVAEAGGGGREVEGGGCKGGGSGLSFNCVSIDGRIEASATVDKDVPADVGFEPMELPQVLPEKPLESDWRGKADFV